MNRHTRQPRSGRPVRGCTYTVLKPGPHLGAEETGRSGRAGRLAARPPSRLRSRLPPQRANGTGIMEKTAAWRRRWGIFTSGEFPVHRLFHFVMAYSGSEFAAPALCGGDLTV